MEEMILRRCRSSSPTDLRRRQLSSAPPVGRRRRTRSLSGLEKCKEVKMLERWEEDHERRLEKLGTLLSRMKSALRATNLVIERYMSKMAVIRAQLHKGEVERARNVLLKMVEERHDREVNIMTTIKRLQQKEKEFINRLEIARTLQFRQLYRQIKNQTT